MYSSLPRDKKASMTLTDNQLLNQSSNCCFFALWAMVSAGTFVIQIESNNCVIFPGLWKEMQSRQNKNIWMGPSVSLVLDSYITASPVGSIYLICDCTDLMGGCRRKEIKNTIKILSAVSQLFGPWLCSSPEIPTWIQFALRWGLKDDQWNEMETEN